MYNHLRIMPLWFLLITLNISCASPTLPTNTTDFKLKSLEACLILAGVKDNNFVPRGSGTRYTELNKQLNTFNGYVEPLAYLVADNAFEIQKAVVCCKLTNVRVVARSGGHSYVKNSYGDSSSMIIDLQKFNNISPNTSEMTCEIGSGLRVGMISDILSKTGNYVVTVGMCPTVGIGGLALGGGYGYFTREFGLASDNLVELEMVNAKGQLLIINDQTNSDLFWALRGGGGGNFGIVTKFKFKMFYGPVSTVYGRYNYTFDSFFQFFNAWQSLITSSDLINAIGTQINMSKNKIEMEIFAYNFSNVLNETICTMDIEQLLTRFSFPNHTDGFITMGSYDVFLSLASDYFTLTDHYDGWKKIKSVYVANVLDNDEISRLQVLLSAYLEWSELYIMQDGGAIDKFARSETAFVHRNFLYNFQLQAFNENSFEPNFEANAAMNMFYEDSKTLLKHRESYQNYLDQDISDYLERYFQENLKRLIDIKRRVDPENVFHHPESIPTMLG